MLAASVAAADPSTLEGDPAIFLMRADGTHSGRVPLDIDALAPSFSPSGDRLVFHGGKRGDDKTTGIWTSRLDGNDLTRVVGGPMSEYSLGDFSFEAPQWSPDGRSIVYEAYADGVDGEPDLGIWMVDADGSSPHRLVDDPGWQEYNPGWSPDGRHVAYQRYPRNVDPIPGYQILTIGLNPGVPTLLDDGPDGTEGTGTVRWAPDAAAIVAVSGVQGGGNQSRLTLVSADPAVQPITVPDPGGPRSLQWDTWTGVSWQPIP
jgi:Tol biopolymer transport system component